MTSPNARLRGAVAQRIGRRRLERGTHHLPTATPADAADQPLPHGWFVNPISEGADPFVIRDGASYLWCHTVADRGVAVCRSDRLTSFGERRVVWTAPDEGPWSREVWAPELIRLDGRWYIYLAASDGRNPTHLAYVLAADTDDPQGPYSLVGSLDTGDVPGKPEWAIDLTVLEYDGRRFALWSGWPSAEERVQHLYIAPMASPTELAGPRIHLTTPDDYPWERIRDDHPEGINEGPQILQRDGRTFVVFSCGSALLPSYKLGLLELTGTDPLDPTHWTKHPEPIFTSTEESFGVGHGTFTTTPDGEWWMVYHRKVVPQRNFKRVIHTQPMTWTDDGLPSLGAPVTSGVPLAVPQGTPVHARSDAARWDLRSVETSIDFDYYGHSQFQVQAPSGLELGAVPATPVNAFRSGEKLVLRDGDYRDVRVEADVEVLAGDKAAGVLLRTTAAAVGVNAQRGYFVGWIASKGRLVIGRTDGVRWIRLAAARAPVAPTLTVEAVGSTITARFGEVELSAEDATYDHGSIGLRVVHTHARFTRLDVHPL